MRLASIRRNGTVSAVLVDGDEIVDLAIASPDLPQDVTSLLCPDDPTRTALAEALASGIGRSSSSGVEFAPPIARPSKFLAVGLNYADHVAESGLTTPEHPTIFAKMPSCIIGAHDDVVRPAVSTQLDYEGELGIVIGRRCRHVTREDAPSVIGGYLTINDVSVRDYQLRDSQWTLGKSFDTHGVLGPWITTADAIDPHQLVVTTTVNGEVRQKSNTKHLIRDCFALVELLSSVCTLEPGDIIATGTPGGVGMARKPPLWLAAGDVVRIEIDGLGSTENLIVEERALNGDAEARTA